MKLALSAVMESRLQELADASGVKIQEYTRVLLARALGLLVTPEGGALQGPSGPGKSPAGPKSPERALKVPKGPEGDSEGGKNAVLPRAHAEEGLLPPYGYPPPQEKETLAPPDPPLAPEAAVEQEAEPSRVTPPKSKRPRDAFLDSAVALFAEVEGKCPAMSLLAQWRKELFGGDGDRCLGALKQLALKGVLSVQPDGGYRPIGYLFKALQGIAVTPPTPLRPAPQPNGLHCPPFYAETMEELNACLLGDRHRKLGITADMFMDDCIEPAERSPPHPVKPVPAP